MPVSDMAAQILSEYVETARLQRARDAIARILDHYGCTQTELAYAMGVAATKGRQSMVSRWIAGHSMPSAENQALLDLLAEGTLALRRDGRDGRRILYSVVAPQELAA